MYTLQWVGVTDPDMLRRVLHSREMPPVGFDWGFYASAVVDRLLDQATLEPNPALRRALYGQVLQLAAVDVPFVSLWYKTTVAIFQPELDGVHLTPTASFAILKQVTRRPRSSAATAAGGIEPLRGR